MPRTTVEQTARRIQRQLSAGLRSEVNRLAAPVDEGSNTVTLTYDLSPSLRQAGAEIEIDRELSRVMAVDVGLKQLTLLRQWRDSEPSDHGIGAEVRINPRFSMQAIVDTMIEELASWPPDLYRVFDFTEAISGPGFDGSSSTFELPLAYADVVRILEVRRHASPTADPSYVDTTWPLVPYRHQRGTTAFGGATTSGHLLRLVDRVAAGSLYVALARPFDVSEFELETDLVDDCGLAVSMLDVLSMGVRQRLIGEQEHASSARDAQQAMPGKEGVPPTAASKDQGQLWAMYLRRRSEEMNKLKLSFPARFL